MYKIFELCLPSMLLCSLILRIPLTLIPLIRTASMAQCTLSVCRNLKYYKKELALHHFSTDLLCRYLNSLLPYVEWPFKSTL
jgi:hypothetical protein